MFQYYCHRHGTNIYIFENLLSIAYEIIIINVTKNLFRRHAALMAISAVGEGCHKQMEAILPQIMDGVIQYLQDPVSLIITKSFLNAMNRVSSYI